jgi:hypothetical protein
VYCLNQHSRTTLAIEATATSLSAGVASTH